MKGTRSTNQKVLQLPKHTTREFGETMAEDTRVYFETNTFAEISFLRAMMVTKIILTNMSFFNFSLRSSANVTFHILVVVIPSGHSANSTI